MREKILFLKCIEDKDISGIDKITELCLTELKTDFSQRRQLIEISIFNKTLKVTLGQLLIACLAIVPRVLLNRKLTINDLLVPKASNNVAKELHKYFSKTIEEAIDDKINLCELKLLIKERLEKISCITYTINQVAGNSVNLYDMLKLMNSNSEISDILNFKVDEASEYYDIVKENQVKTNRLLELLLNDTDHNCYKNIMSSISFGQFQQVFCNIGYKPEVNSSGIYPHCVNTNLFQGLRSPQDYFVSAMGARKALITNA